MANLLRLILLASIFIFNINNSFASTSTVPVQVQMIWQGTVYGTPTAFCLAVYGANSAYSNISGTDTTYQVTCAFRYLNGNQTNNFQKDVSCKFGVQQGAFCLVTSPDCVLPQTLDTNTNTCVSPPVCTVGQGPTGYLATSSCLDGCTHVWSGQTAKIGDITYGMYLGKTGGNCSIANGNPLMNKGDVDAAMKAADDKAAADAAAAKAAKDAKNAADKAAAASAAADAKAKSDQAASDKAAADAAAKKAADDAADSTKTASEKAASSAAAQAAKDKSDDSKAAAATSAGAAASTAKTEEQPEFCALHPSSIICKNSSVVAGTCSGGVSSGFSCSGDAIQCQIAQEQQAANCKFYEKDDAAKSEFDSLKNGIANNPADTANRLTISLPDSLNSSSEGFAATCPVDGHFVLTGHDFIIPISKYCPYLTGLGYIFLALAYITAAKIIGGSV